MVVQNYLKNFNSRPSARGDPIRTHVQRSGFVFQFTPLREGRRLPHHWHSQRGNISIHAPPRGATHACAFVLPHKLISIHAPPRGATWRWSIAGRADSISIHAPPRGATGRSGGVLHDHQRHFNSRPSARGDITHVFCAAILAISIHAPPRGATRQHAGGTKACANFNSRPSARGDTR